MYNWSGTSNNVQQKTLQKRENILLYIHIKQLVQKFFAIINNLLLLFTFQEPTMMKESERIVCEWAESKFGKFNNVFNHEFYHSISVKKCF